MSWYAAHIVMAVKQKAAGQTRWPIWENIVLLQARSEREAFSKAERYGKAEEGDDGGTFTWQGAPARWVFAGVRKVTACVDPSRRPEDFTEVTFSEFELPSKQALERYASGDEAELVSADRFANAGDDVLSATTVSKRKRA